MKARDLCHAYPEFPSSARADDLADVLRRQDVRAVLVLSPAGELMGVVSDSSLLRRLLPSYVDEDESLAGVVGEDASTLMQSRLGGLIAADLVLGEQEERPVVDADDTLIEVASVMVRSRSPAVGVVDRGRLLGGIGIEDLLRRLLGTA